MNKLIVISGPTASGKTSTSILLARKITEQLKLNTVIVNFDSLLFYKEISIGTAKPTLEERADVPHYMIDIESIKSPMNAADFVKLGEGLIKELMNQNKIIILVGGSAFYLRALLKGMYESPSSGPDKSEEVERLYREKGIGPVIEFLKENDPESLVHLHENDHYRLMRAMIHFKNSGKKISDQKTKMDQQSPYDFSDIVHPWSVLHLYLDLPKDEHFEIIKKRTKKMFEDGLLEEIASLKSRGFSLKEKPLSSIGYKEALLYLDGGFDTLENCIERISISTRQLAKSQRTFFKKITPKISFDPIKDQEKIFKNVEQFLQK